MRHPTRLEMQHTHKAPLSADAILNDYLMKQQKYTFSPKTTAPHKLAHSQRHQNLLFSTSARRHGLSGRASERTLQHPHPHPHQERDELHNSTQDTATSAVVQVQRKLLAFFLIYAAIILSLYLAYALYSYHQQAQLRRQQQQFFESTSTSTAPSASLQEAPVTPASSLLMQNTANSDLTLDPNEPSAQQKLMQEFQAKFESKLHLLERYIEVLALDLEDTKSRLKEREKCACSIGCSFNGTRYNDGQRWQQKCDTCVCKSGRISCGPRECPKLAPSCQDAVQLPNQCCPTCMKMCKLNNKLVRHGHTFKPPASSKQCKCLDGLIKCESLKLTSSALKSDQLEQQQQQQQQQKAKNKTMEYLKTILGAAGGPKAAQPIALEAGEHKRPVRVTTAAS